MNYYSLIIALVTFHFFAWQAEKHLPQSPCECFRNTVDLEEGIVQHSRSMNLYEFETRDTYSDRLDTLNQLLNKLETTLRHCQRSFYAKSNYCDSIYHDITIWKIPNSEGKTTVQTFANHFRTMYSGDWQTDSLKNSRAVKLDSLWLFPRYGQWVDPTDSSMTSGSMLLSPN